MRWSDFKESNTSSFSWSCRITFCAKAAEVEKMIAKTTRLAAINKEYQKVDQKIKETKAISIMFSQPDGTSFNNVMTILDDPEQKPMLNRQFYYI
jgi:hypothetical protein